MKDKIIPLVIGILIGAVITAIGFLTYIKMSGPRRPDFNFENPPSMGQRQDSKSGSRPDRETPPDFQKPGEKNETSKTDDEPSSTT